MVFIILVLLVALGVLSPYLLVAYKRRKMLRRLTYIARSSGFRVRKLHRFVCFSFNRAPRYDLLFENKTHAYAVKLWSAVRKSSTLYIRANGTVVESMEIPSVLDTDVSSERTVRGREKKVAVTKNNFKVRKGKPVVGIMLYYPPNKQMILSLGSTQRVVGSGDRIFDKIVCNAGRFEQMLADDGAQIRRDVVST